MSTAVSIILGAIAITSVCCVYLAVRIFGTCRTIKQHRMNLLMLFVGTLVILTVYFMIALHHT